MRRQFLSNEIDTSRTETPSGLESRQGQINLSIELELALLIIHNQLVHSCRQCCN